MEKLIAVSFKAIRSVFAPGMLGVFLSSIFITLFALCAFIFGVTGLAAGISRMIGDADIAANLPWIAGMGTSLLAYFLFPGIMPVVVNFFDSKIAGLIEQQDYQDARPIDPPFWPEFWHDLLFSIKAIGINILLFPFYFIPLFGQILFFLINGHLLGKEFFVMSARRYMPISEATALHKQHGRTILIGGMMLTLCATIPVVNLFAPFWGIALMTHLYHAIKNTAKVEVLPPVDRDKPER